MFCAPANIENYSKNGTCYSKEALEKMADLWNAGHPSKSRIALGKGSKEIYKELTDKLSDKCKGKGEWCYADVLGYETGKHFFRPPRPSSWNRNRYEWLSNFDIEHVMKQYEEDKRMCFRFLGVFPIDFATGGKGGRCLYHSMCNPELFKGLRSQGIRNVGAVFNLDRHDQPGSHWVSMFIGLDPSLPSYGANYYDSVANPTPREIADFMESVKKDVGDPDFPLRVNKVKHQTKNSECGIFSMVFIIRFLEAYKREQPISMDQILTNKVQITNKPFGDTDANEIRNVLFRPHTIGTQRGGRKKSPKKKVKKSPNQKKKVNTPRKRNVKKKISSPRKRKLRAKRSTK